MIGRGMKRPAIDVSDVKPVFTRWQLAGRIMAVLVLICTPLLYVIGAVLIIMDEAEELHSTVMDHQRTALRLAFGRWVNRQRR